MTAEDRGLAELIVALDGPNPAYLASQLEHELGLLWFKIGPQAMTSPDWPLLMDSARRGAKLFLDLKLADTRDTTQEAARRFAEIGIAAVSTFTDGATRAALCGANESGLRVWRILRLTDSDDPLPHQILIGDGVICSVGDLRALVAVPANIEKVCPGIRRASDEPHGHKRNNTPQRAAEAGATHIVVGRPIWQADDSVAAARQFMTVSQ